MVGTGTNTVSVISWGHLFTKDVTRYHRQQKQISRSKGYERIFFFFLKYKNQQKRTKDYFTISHDPILLNIN